MNAATIVVMAALLQLSDALVCDSSPCINGGTCVDGGTSYQCNCLRGFTGTNCQMLLPCDSNPCYNGGACVPGPNGSNYSCSCTADWAGRRCQTAVPVSATSGFVLESVDMASPVGNPSVAVVVSTKLDCGRLCLSDPSCQGFAVDRDVLPTDGVNCRIYYLVTAFQSDAKSITYKAGNNRLPTH